MPSYFYVLNPVGVIVVTVLISFAGTAAGIYFASTDRRRPRVNYVVWYVGLLLALQAVFGTRGWLIVTQNFVLFSSEMLLTMHVVIVALVALAHGRLAAERSQDAWGHKRGALLAFIPVANAILFFVTRREGGEDEETATSESEQEPSPEQETEPEPDPEHEQEQIPASKPRTGLAVCFAIAMLIWAWLVFEGVGRRFP